jgi:hypothetical protein
MSTIQNPNTHTASPSTLAPTHAYPTFIPPFSSFRPRLACVSQYGLGTPWLVL